MDTLGEHTFYYCRYVNTTFTIYYLSFLSLRENIHVTAVLKAIAASTGSPICFKRIVNQCISARLVRPSEQTYEFCHVSVGEVLRRMMDENETEVVIVVIAYVDTA